MNTYPNETVRSIMERRSIRKFLPQQITDTERDCIIECGLYAPSAMNNQHWHFTVIQNAGLIGWMNDKIKEKMPPDAAERYKSRQDGREDYSMFYGTPTVILISGDGNSAYAVENMCVAAQSLGVASIIIGMAHLIFETPEATAYAKEFGIPDGFEPQYAVCFGYADMKSEPAERAPERVNYIS